MNSLIPITYDDFYKFATSLGLLIFAFSLYSLSRSTDILAVAGLFVGGYLTLWAGNKWYGKQKVRDRIEELQLQKELAELEKAKPQK